MSKEIRDISFKCKGYEVHIAKDRNSWSVTTSGILPKKVKDNIEELEKHRHLTTIETVYVVLRGATKDDCLYTF